MTNELKTNLKELEKLVNNSMRKISKEYGYKIISNSIYKMNSDFFLHGVFFTRINKENLTIFIRMYAKPYKSDDIFWTIFDMKENIGQKESLRANGAFVAPSIQFSEASFEIVSQDVLENICRLTIEKFNKEGELFLESINRNVDEFVAYTSKHTGIMHQVLIKMLASIQLGHYEIALNMAENELKIGNHGYFQNNGKDIYEYIAEYCLKNQQS